MPPPGCPAGTAAQQVWLWAPLPPAGASSRLAPLSAPRTWATTQIFETGPSVCPTHLGCNPGALTPSLFFILPLSNHQTLHPRLGQSLFLRAHRHIYQLPSDHILSYLSAYASIFPAGWWATWRQGEDSFHLLICNPQQHLTWGLNKYLLHDYCWMTCRCKMLYKREMQHRGVERGGQRGNLITT